MSRSQFQSKRFILRHAWLNLWDERMTTGRINQVAILPRPKRSTSGRANAPPQRPPHTDISGWQADVDIPETTLVWTIVMWNRIGKFPLQYVTGTGVWNSVFRAQLDQCHQQYHARELKSPWSSTGNFNSTRNHTAEPTLLPSSALPVYTGWHSGHCRATLADRNFLAQRINQPNKTVLSHTKKYGKIWIWVTVIISPPPSASSDWNNARFSTDLPFTSLGPGKLNWNTALFPSQLKIRCSLAAEPR